MATSNNVVAAICVLLLGCGELIAAQELPRNIIEAA